MQALISLMLAAAFATAGAQAPSAKGEAVDAGKAAYAAKCATCHAKDGKGNAAMAKMFKVEAVKLNLLSDDTLKKKDADLVKVISEGRAKMPKFKEKLKDAEIAGIVSYLRGLVAAKPAAKPADKPAK